MPSLLGRLTGISFQAELLTMNFLGLVNSTLDWSSFVWADQLEKIWNLSLTRESFVLDTIGEQRIKTILSGVVISRIIVAHVYTFTYVTNIYPILTWSRPNLLLPWMILSFFKNVVLEVIVIVIGILLCYEKKFPAVLLVEFVLVKVVPLVLAGYNWYSNSCLYAHLKHVERMRRLRRTLKSESVMSTGRLYEKVREELSVERYKTRSLTTLVSTGSQETDDSHDSISWILENPDLTPAEKLKRILGITEEDIEEAVARVKAKRSTKHEIPNYSTETKDQDVSSEKREKERQKEKEKDVALLEMLLDTEEIVKRLSAVALGEKVEGEKITKISVGGIKGETGEEKRLGKKEREENETMEEDEEIKNVSSRKKRILTTEEVTAERQTKTMPVRPCGSLIRRREAGFCPVMKDLGRSTMEMFNFSLTDSKAKNIDSLRDSKPPARNMQHPNFFICDCTSEKCNSTHKAAKDKIDKNAKENSTSRTETSKRTDVNPRKMLDARTIPSTMKLDDFSKSTEDENDTLREKKVERSFDLDDNANIAVCKEPTPLSIEEIEETEENEEIEEIEESEEIEEFEEIEEKQSSKISAAKPEDQDVSFHRNEKPEGSKPRVINDEENSSKFDFPDFPPVDIRVSKRRTYKSKALFSPSMEKYFLDADAYKSFSRQLEEIAVGFAAGTKTLSFDRAEDGKDFVVPGMKDIEKLRQKEDSASKENCQPLTDNKKYRISKIEDRRILRDHVDVTGTTNIAIQTNLDPFLSLDLDLVEHSKPKSKTKQVSTQTPRSPDKTVQKKFIDYKRPRRYYHVKHGHQKNVRKSPPSDDISLTENTKKHLNDQKIPPKKYCNRLFSNSTNKDDKIERQRSSSIESLQSNKQNPRLSSSNRNIEVWRTKVDRKEQKETKNWKNVQSVRNESLASRVRPLVTEAVKVPGKPPICPKTRKKLVENRSLISENSVSRGNRENSSNEEAESRKRGEIRSTDTSSSKNEKSFEFLQKRKENRLQLLKVYNELTLREDKRELEAKRAKFFGREKTKVRGDGVSRATETYEDYSDKENLCENSEVEGNEWKSRRNVSSNLKTKKVEAFWNDCFDGERERRRNERSVAAKTRSKKYCGSKKEEDKGVLCLIERTENREGRELDRMISKENIREETDDCLLAGKVDWNDLLDESDLVEHVGRKKEERKEEVEVLADFGTKKGETKEEPEIGVDGRRKEEERKGEFEIVSDARRKKEEMEEESEMVVGGRRKKEEMEDESEMVVGGQTKKEEIEEKSEMVVGGPRKKEEMEKKFETVVDVQRNEKEMKEEFEVVADARRKKEEMEEVSEILANVGRKTGWKKVEPLEVVASVQRELKKEGSEIVTSVRKELKKGFSEIVSYIQKDATGKGFSEIVESIQKKLKENSNIIPLVERESIKKRRREGEQIQDSIDEQKLLKRKAEDLLVQVPSKKTQIDILADQKNQNPTESTKTEDSLLQEPSKKTQIDILVDQKNQNPTESTKAEDSLVQEPLKKTQIDILVDQKNQNPTESTKTEDSLLQEPLKKSQIDIPAHQTKESPPNSTEAPEEQTQANTTTQESQEPDKNSPTTTTILSTQESVITTSSDSSNLQETPIILTEDHQESPTLENCSNDHRGGPTARLQLDNFTRTIQRTFHPRGVFLSNDKHLGSSISLDNPEDTQQRDIVDDVVASSLHRAFFNKPEIIVRTFHRSPRVTEDSSNFASNGNVVLDGFSRSDRPESTDQFVCRVDNDVDVLSNDVPPVSEIPLNPEELGRRFLSNIEENLGNSDVEGDVNLYVVTIDQEEILDEANELLGRSGNIEAGRLDFRGIGTTDLESTFVEILRNFDFGEFEDLEERSPAVLREVPSVENVEEHEGSLVPRGSVDSEEKDVDSQVEESTVNEVFLRSILEEPFWKNLRFPVVFEGRDSTFTVMTSLNDDAGTSKAVRDIRRLVGTQLVDERKEELEERSSVVLEEIKEDGETLVDRETRETERKNLETEVETERWRRRNEKRVSKKKGQTFPARFEYELQVHQPRRGRGLSSGYLMDFNSDGTLKVSSPKVSRRSSIDSRHETFLNPLSITEIFPIDTEPRPVSREPVETCWSSSSRESLNRRFYTRESSGKVEGKEDFQGRAEVRIDEVEKEICEWKNEEVGVEENTNFASNVEVEEREAQVLHGKIEEVGVEENKNFASNVKVEEREAQVLDGKNEEVSVEENDNFGFNVKVEEREAEVFDGKNEYVQEVENLVEIRENEVESGLSLTRILLFCWIAFVFYFVYFYKWIFSFSRFSVSTNTSRRFDVHSVSTSTSKIINKTIIDSLEGLQMDTIEEHLENESIGSSVVDHEEKYLEDNESRSNDPTIERISSIEINKVSQEKDVEENREEVSTILVKDLLDKLSNNEDYLRYKSTLQLREQKNLSDDIHSMEDESFFDRNIEYQNTIDFQLSKMNKPSSKDTKESADVFLTREEKLQEISTTRDSIFKVFVETNLQESSSSGNMEEDKNTEVDLEESKEIEDVSMKTESKEEERIPEMDSFDSTFTGYSVKTEKSISWAEEDPMEEFSTNETIEATSSCGSTDQPRESRS